MNWKRIRERRKELNLTLKELSNLTGYSVAYISQIERDKKQPSLAFIRAIADSLNCSETWLMMGNKSNPLREESNPTGVHNTYLVRVEDRIPMQMPEIKSKYQVLTPSVLPQGEKPLLSSLLLSLEPGAAVTESMISHKYADESIYVLSGQMEVYIGDLSFQCQSGDNVFIPRNAMHNYVNIGKDYLKCIVTFSEP